MTDLVMCDDDRLAALLGEVVARETIHWWPLSWVQRIELADGSRYAYKSQLPPTVEPEFYEAARSPLLPRHRRLDRFGVCDTMIVEWLDVPRLDQLPEGKERLAHAWPVLGQIAELDPSLPVYLDLGSVEHWLETSEETFGKLRTLEADGRLPSITPDELNRLRQWAVSRPVLAQFEAPPRIAHADLGADQIFVLDKGYRVIDWQRPVLGPRGLDTVALLEDLGLDPRPYVDREIYALSHFLLLHWAVFAQHDLFPDSANPGYDNWAKTSTTAILA
jgi:hypothetical protein